MKTIMLILVASLLILSACGTESVVYNNLNDNLCDLQPECCGEFNEDQQRFRRTFEVAVEQNIPELCDQLPEEPFIIKCQNKPDRTYYGQDACKELTS